MYPQSSLRNLNYAYIHDADAASQPISQRIHRIMPLTSPACRVDAVFSDLELRLCQIITQYPVVVGCTAWLTSFNVLDALRGREVSLIVQKEDWLRPDAGQSPTAGPYGRAVVGDWKSSMRARYAALTGIQDRHAFNHGYNQLSCEPYDPVRCAGILNQHGQKNATPRMHHKFMVFGKYVMMHYEVPAPDNDLDEHDQWVFVPEAVWTGSYNPTTNATRSLENAVIIHDLEIARVFAEEWGAVLGFSEPLDWNATWVASDMRIGT